MLDQHPDISWMIASTERTLRERDADRHRGHARPRRSASRDARLGRLLRGLAGLGPGRRPGAQCVGCPI